MLEPVISLESHNSDGSSNKTITITAVSRGVPYTCLAMDIPGHGERQQEFALVLGTTKETPVSVITKDAMQVTTSTTNDHSNTSIISK